MKKQVSLERFKEICFTINKNVVISYEIYVDYNYFNMEVILDVILTTKFNTKTLYIISVSMFEIADRYEDILNCLNKNIKD